MDFSLPAELEDLRARARRFVQTELAPHANLVDELDTVPPQLYRRIRERAIKEGLFAVNMPKEVGGQGVGTLGMMVFREELAKTSMAMSYTVWGPAPILLFCTPEQRRDYLLPAVRGAKVDAFAITEPNAGSDAAAIETSAVRDGSSYVLNGRKTFISNGDAADFVIVCAVTDRQRRARGGVTAFLVDKGTPGFKVAAIIPTMGWRGQNHAELVLENCVLPESKILGGLGMGFVMGMRWIMNTRLEIAASAIGTTRVLIDACRERLGASTLFGQPRHAAGSVRRKLADMEIELYAARQLTYSAAQKMDEGGEARLESPSAKMYAAEMLHRAIDTAIELHGTIGITTGFPFERYYRDARVLRIADGTGEILRHLIAREVLRE